MLLQRSICQPSFKIPGGDKYFLGFDKIPLSQGSICQSNFKIPGGDNIQTDWRTRAFDWFLRWSSWFTQNQVYSRAWNGWEDLSWVKIGIPYVVRLG